ncbi:endoribonuclease GhoS [Yersinia enterocolitica]|nr:type V toxin-antitoxin system endoribonuclease antitoxin GhoS [Yersinia enterocolitica]EKN6106568.1 endoribonuclease GhoS [Yersinia enterocolitica]
MADYLVRVELFDANSEDYESLYDAMATLGFSKTIQSPGGVVRKLPTGTYVGVKATSVADVRDSVCKIANPLSSKAAAVFVCSFTDWASLLYADS